VEYRPYDELDGIANVVVDGAAHPDTLIALSHWPHSGTPVELRDDLSAQIAFHYLDHPEHHVPADAVSNNHFDQDGLMSVYALVDPGGAQDRRDRVIDVARAGDFGSFHERDAARISWTIAALAAQEDGDPYPRLLERVPDLLDHPERYREIWADEDAHLEASEAAIRAGTVTIEEDVDLDLAVVTVPTEWAEHTVHRFTTTPRAAVHPGAVHNATDRFRLLFVQGRHYEVQYRYETWVHYMSRRPLGRVDLAPLAASLSEREPYRAVWQFDGVGGIFPTMQLRGATESAIPPAEFRVVLTQALAGPSAWDPYD
jgi:hypothetical protein